MFSGESNSKNKFQNNFSSFGKEYNFVPENSGESIFPEMEAILERNPFLSTVFSLLSLICLTSIVAFLLNFLVGPNRLLYSALSLVGVVMPLFIAITITVAIKWNARRKMRAAINTYIKNCI